MNIKEFAESLDDYSGSLALSVETLELERARGTLKLAEQEDLLGDLHEAVQARHLNPWRRKVLLGLLPGMLLIALGGFSFGKQWNGFLGLLAAIPGGLFLLWGIYALWRLQKVRRLEFRWLGEVEKRLQQGGTVFDQDGR